MKITIFVLIAVLTAVAGEVIRSTMQLFINS